MRAWHKYQLQLFLVVLIILFLVFPCWIFRIVLQESITKLVKEKQEITLLMEVENTIGFADSVYTERKKMLDKITHLKNMSMTKHKPSEFIEDIALTSTKHGLILSDINSLESITIGNVIEYPFELSISGSFTSFHKFIADMENKNKVVFVKSFLIHSDEINGKLISGNVLLSVYISNMESDRL